MVLGVASGCLCTFKVVLTLALVLLCEIGLCDMNLISKVVFPYIYPCTHKGWCIHARCMYAFIVNTYFHIHGGRCTVNSGLYMYVLVSAFTIVLQAYFT